MTIQRGMDMYSFMGGLLAMILLAAVTTLFMTKEHLPTIDQSLALRTVHLDNSALGVFVWSA